MHVSKSTISKGLTLLLAVAGGISLANIYYNQPLLPDIAKTFHTTSSAVGLLSTLTQLGYASGLFFFVPLGDLRDKRRLILTLIALVTVSLLGVSSAQNLVWLYVASYAVGLTGVVPQVIIPLAAQLAKPEERGKVIGTVVSGLLIGVLLARTVSGYIGYLVGWRYMFVFAAVLMCLLTVILYFKLPATEFNANLTYKELLKSIFNIARKYPTLRQATLTQAMIFGAFSVFWTTMSFLLENPPYDLHSNQVGLFGLVGVAGASAATIIGSLTDKKDPKLTLAMCIVIGIFSYVVFWFFGMNIWGLIVGVILLDFGVQGAQVSNQARIYRLSHDEGSRINTVFTVGIFIGGAIASSLGAFAWSLYHWTGVCIVGITMILIALGTLLVPLKFAHIDTLRGVEDSE